MAAPWCSCLASERTLSCPACLKCFCQAAPAYKRRFWSAAPRLLWDQKFAEHGGPAPVWTNPEPDELPRPLVLVVDDERDIRRVARLILTRLGGRQVAKAQNGAETLERAPRTLADQIRALLP